MAPDNNWLSFSLSSMEMFSGGGDSSQPPHMLESAMKLAPFEVSSSSAAAAASVDSSNHYYFSDNFFSHGWQSSSTRVAQQVMFTESENQVKEEEEAVVVTGHHGNMNGVHNHNHNHNQHHEHTSIFTSFLEQHQPPPKLEDFLGGDSTETQDSSSLTHIYDHAGSGSGSGSVAYFSSDQQDFKTMAGFQAFSTNSGSEVDDSASVVRTHQHQQQQQLVCGEFTGQSIESGNSLGYSQCPNGALSLGVNAKSTTTSTDQKAIVESDSCKKITDTFGQRTSIYRGVTRHRWTGRYEAHLWDNSCRREGQARKGRQVYLGGYDKEEKAARAYDLAALKYWGPTATTNFPVSNYTKELEEMKLVTKQEFIASLRRKSSGFSRGASIYRGVTRHHQQGRWQARIGRVAGNKDLYLGTFATEEEAAEAYDIAAIKFRGVNAVTNFEMNRYDIEAIMKSALPIGGAAKRLKLSLESEQKPSLSHQPTHCVSSSTINFSAIQPAPIPCGVPFDVTTPPPPVSLPYYHHNLFHHLNGNPIGGGASESIGPMLPLLPSPAEFFIWPHQSY